MFFPAVLFAYIRLKLCKGLDKNRVSIYEFIFSYTLGAILINSIIILMRKIIVGGERQYL